MEKSGNRQDLLTVGLLLSFLLCHALAYAAGLRASEIENRRLAKFPELSTSLLFSFDPGAQFSAFIKDRLPLRGKLLSWHNWLIYFGLGDVPGTLLARGQGDWLFLRRTIEEAPGSHDSDPAVCLPLYDELIDAARSAGIRPLIVISPNKVSLYPEFLLEADRPRHKQAELRQIELEEHFDGPLAEFYLNLWEPLRTEKQVLLERSATNWTESRLRFLFRPSDRHWPSETALIQAREIVERLAPGQLRRTPTWPLAIGYQLKPSEFSSIPLGFELLEPYTEVGPQPAGLTQKSDGQGSNKIETFTTVDFQADRRRLVVIHDSFMDASIPFLVTHFRETVFIHWNLLKDRPDLALKTILSADLLVCQMVDDSRQETRHTLIRWLIRRLKDKPPQ